MASLIALEAEVTEGKLKIPSGKIPKKFHGKVFLTLVPRENEFASLPKEFWEEYEKTNRLAKKGKLKFVKAKDFSLLKL